MKKRPSPIVTLLLSLLILAVGCSKNSSSEVSLTDIGKEAETTSITIYYPRNGELVATYARVRKQKDLAAKALNLLLSLPEKQGMGLVVLPKAKVIYVKTTTDTCIINFSKSILDFNATPREKKLAWAAIAFTASEVTSKNKVKFLVEGRESGKIDGKEIGIFWGEITLKNQPWVVK